MSALKLSKQITESDQNLVQRNLHVIFNSREFESGYCLPLSMGDGLH